MLAVFGYRPAALCPLLVILVQAGAYWLLSRDWVGLAPMPSSGAMVFRALRVINVIVLLAGLIGMLVRPPAYGLLGLDLRGVTVRGRRVRQLLRRSDRLSA